MRTARITIFAGHYGSGKTNLAVNYAIWLKKSKSVDKAVVCDLDIVNPYFRTADSIEPLNEHGIDLIASDYANTNVDVPSIPSAVQSIFDNRDIHAIIDLGGDDRGALALGRYSKNINKENNYEMLLVVNKYRPMTRDIVGMRQIKDEIEASAGVKFSGIVNNSNLGRGTVIHDITDSLPFIAELSEKLGLPLVMTTISEHVLERAKKTDLIQLPEVNIFPIEIYGKTTWKI